MKNFLIPPDVDNDKKAVSLLSQPLDKIKGIGKTYAEKLARHKIFTVYDFLFTFPFRYETLSVGDYGEKGVLHGVFEQYGLVRTRGGKRMLKATFKNDDGYISAVWLNPKGEYPASTLEIGAMYYLFGNIKSQGGSASIFHPDFVREADLGKIRSIYLSPKGLSQTVYRKFVSEALKQALKYLDDTLPEYLLDKYNYPSLRDAVQTLHTPMTIENINEIETRRHPSYKRFIYEEFLYVRLASEIKRKSYSEIEGIPFQIDKDLMNGIKDIMPFKLTAAQKHVIVEIFNDMIKPKQMNRLVQGDVGSGKTVLAFIASTIAIENGYQTLLIAPTEVLAEQHFASLTTKFKYHNIRPCLITGSVTKKNKQEIKQLITAGAVNFIIGTHAILEDDVEFNKLGLVIVDEQHRFGVKQRKKLIDKGYNPDIILMTATPIPRTLAMTLYGDLDVSIIDELPPGRIPSITKSYSSKQLNNALDFAKIELDKGGRAYFVYPLIDESDKLELKNATQSYEYIKNYYKTKKIGLLHGKMKSDEKRNILNSFKTGEIEILVSTTVIEVGVDVPEATVMVIENAERFGLSQLHQLRGRIGRNDIQSYCLLISGEDVTETGKQRIKAMVNYRDGFKLAEEDLKIRGQGDFFGTKQSGVPEFKFANIVTDTTILKCATNDAVDIIEYDPDLLRIENKRLKETFIKLYSGERSYLGIG